jgi:hypothetical protein
MPEISPMSLAHVVSQAAHANGYQLRGPVLGTDPTGGVGYSAFGGGPGSPLGGTPVNTATGRLGRAGGWNAVRQFVVRAPGSHIVGQSSPYGIFGRATPQPPPLCSDTRFWVDGAAPANCVQPKPRLGFRGVAVAPPVAPPVTSPSSPAQPCIPQPCMQQPCAPQPCEGPIGGMMPGGGGGCPPPVPCPKFLPWGWIVVASLGALLSGMQFYGKVGGGKLV